MGSFELLYICLAALLWVFTILVFLAAVMSVIMKVFPKKDIGPDASVIAALSAAMHTLFPGSKITQIEEKK